VQIEIFQQFHLLYKISLKDPHTVITKSNKSPPPPTNPNVLYNISTAPNLEFLVVPPSVLYIHFIIMSYRHRQRHHKSRKGGITFPPTLRVGKSQEENVKRSEETFQLQLSLSNERNSIDPA
jgi:hypothetical protein